MNAETQSSFWRTLEWRFDAWRSGKTFETIAAERTLIFRVEQVFLIHRRTHQWLLHVAANSAAADDTHVFRELEKYVRESFFFGDEISEEFFLDDKRILIAFGPEAYLAAVVIGEPPHALREMLTRTIARIHQTCGAALRDFNGDSAPFRNVASELTACLQSAHRSYPPSASWPKISLPRLPRFRRATLLVTALAFALLFFVGYFFAHRSHEHWKTFVARLSSEPGILVTQSEWHWLKTSRVRGLRDPLAKDPKTIAQAAGVNSARAKFDLREFDASDSAIVQRRFLQRFGAVDGAEINVQNGVAEISGRVPSEWLERVRREAKQVPGVKSIAEHDVTVVYDPGRVLQQFETRFSPPSTVRVAVANKTLILAGKAPYEWIAAVQQSANEIPGISAINGDDLVVEINPELMRERFRERFGLPDGVRAIVQNGRLILSGEAPHAWLDQVRREVMNVPGVRVLDDREVVDVDQREFLEAKSNVDAAVVVFILNRGTLTPEATANIAQVAEQIRRCFAAAAKMGVNTAVELRGYGDVISSEIANAGLSKRRADAVQKALVTDEIDPAKIDSLGVGTPYTPQFDRRVFFKIVIRP